MFCAQSVRHGLSRKLPISGQLRRTLVTDADVEQARKHCLNQLRKGDYESYLLRPFVPWSARDAYDALRTLNLELARLPETVSHPTIGRFRMQFWRDTINNVFAGKPPREPISILLHRAITDLAERSSLGGANSLRFWLLRFINTREQYMDNRPFASLAALEEYAENTYATLMYMTLASMPLRSVHLDHLASHIGRACGIVAVLRGVAALATPSPPVQSPAGVDVGGGRSPVLLLPLDVMAEAGLKEEDVFRKGPDAPGLQDAVFKVATRAHDHLITAREMLKNLRAGETPGHDYEHEGEAQHVYVDEASEGSAERDIRRGFGVLLEAVPAGDFLTRLENVDFDPFKIRAGWKLPWSIWQALKKEQI